MTRIRYKNQNGTLVSKSFKTPTDEVIVNIKTDGSFIICNTKGELLFNSTSNSPDLQKTKKLAKQALIELGVSFQAEVRPRLKDSEFTAQDEAEMDYDQEHNS